MRGFACTIGCVALGVLGCQPARSPSEACRQQNVWSRVGRSSNPDPRLDAIEDLRCDEMARDERREAREDAAREADRLEREQARREIVAALAPRSSPTARLDTQQPPQGVTAAVAAPSSRSPGPSRCGDRSGRYYTIVYSERAGNCGPQKGGRVQWLEPRTFHPPCQGTFLYSVDNCSVHYVSACEASSAGGIDRSSTTTDETWSQDGTEGRATEALTFEAASGKKCSSLYDITMRMQP